MSTKTDRTRFLPLSTPAVDVLRRQAAREVFSQPDDVFVGRFGERLNDSALRRRYHAGRTAAGLRAVKLHGLRYAAGSIYARNASAVEVRDFLGHAKLSTTDRYITARFNQDALDRLDAAFTARQSAPT